MFSAEVYEWGLAVIRAVQQAASPALTAVMKAVSFAGDVPFYALVLAILFWCGDTRRGFRIACAVLFSGALNTAVKNTLCVPRPFIADSNVGLAAASGYSTPSGHAQLAATFWPLAASGLRKKALRICAAVVPPLLIGFSRIYLGVHYPSDVLLGLCVGMLISLGALLWGDALAVRAARLPRMIRILCVSVIAFLFNHFSDGDVTLSALFWGFSCGYVLLCETAAVDGRLGSPLQKALRVIAGCAVLFVLYELCSFAASALFSGGAELFRFAEYALLGACASFVLPHLFLRAGLYASARI